MKRTKKETKKNTQTEKESVRFFKSNLPTIVWDPNNDCSLADFSKGHFTTDDERVIDILKEKGYQIIPLDSTEPPAIIINQATHNIKEGSNIPVMSENARPKAVEQMMDHVTETKPPEVVV